MICARCGKEIRDKSRFCSYCGEAQNVPARETKGIPKTVSVCVYLDSIRLNIASDDKNAIDGISDTLTTQLSGNGFFSIKKTRFVQSTGFHHIDWFMPVDVKDPFGWDDFLCNAYKAVFEYLTDNGFRYQADTRQFYKVTQA